MQTQPTPVQQEAQLIAAKERERADNSRFASNLAYARAAAPSPQQQQSQMMPAQYDHSEGPASSSLVVPRSAEGKEETPANGYKRPLEANVDSAIGQPYLVYEGSVLDTVLMNRLDGDAVGPVKVLVSNPLYPTIINTSSFPREPLSWAKQRRLEQRVSANSAAWPWSFTA
jgi:type IV secretion system protein VirB10